MPPPECRPRAGIQGRRGQLPCPSCQNPSATGIRCCCQAFTGQELRLMGPRLADLDVQPQQLGAVWWRNVRQQQPKEPGQTPRRQRGGTWGPGCGSCWEMAAARQCCHLPSLPACSAKHRHACLQQKGS